MKDFDLQIIIAAGPLDLERATLGLSIAVSTAANGDAVVVFLTMQGAKWAAPEPLSSGSVLGFEPPIHYLNLLIEIGVRIEVCTSCYETFCPAPRGDDGRKLMRPGLVLAGLSIAALRASQVKTIAF